MKKQKEFSEKRMEKIVESFTKKLGTVLFPSTWRRKHPGIKIKMVAG